jgi:hypothetical protein
MSAWVLKEGRTHALFYARFTPPGPRERRWVHHLGRYPDLVKGLWTAGLKERALRLLCVIVVHASLAMQEPVFGRLDLSFVDTNTPPDFKKTPFNDA